MGDGWNLLKGAQRILHKIIKVSRQKAWEWQRSELLMNGARNISVFVNLLNDGFAQKQLIRRIFKVLSHSKQISSMSPLISRLRIGSGICKSFRQFGGAWNTFMLAGSKRRAGTEERNAPLFANLPKHECPICVRKRHFLVC